MIGAGSRTEMAAFVRAVELGAFSSAARELRLTPSALSKLVSRLEKRLGVRLMNRTTRRVALTPEGALFFERCRGILADIENAENEVMRSHERPRGRLRLHVGVGFAVHQVVPALPRFHRRYPDIEVDLVVEDRNLDVIKEDIDISVRPGPTTETSLVVRKIFAFERVVCASPEYLRRYGAPRSPDDLAKHTCIVLSGFSNRTQWPFQTASGRRLIDLAPSTRVNNADCALRLGLMGAGIVRLNEFVVAEELSHGRLVRVLPDYHWGESVEMIALYRQARHRLPRVAAMLDFLAKSFGHAPWRTRGSQ